MPCYNNTLCQIVEGLFMAGQRLKLMIVLSSVLTCVVLKVAGRQLALSFSVTGAVTTPLTLTVETLAQMPRGTVSISQVGIDTQYDGVWLHELLKKAGVPTSETLRGKALTTYVLAEAQDGYQVVFSLGELDPELGDTPILVADRANGRALSGENRLFDWCYLETSALRVP